MENKDTKQIVGAIILAGAMIAGAILIRGGAPVANNGAKETTSVAVAPVTDKDRTLGNPKAKVAVVVYEDFQCPFCGAVSGLAGESEAVKYLKEIAPDWQPFMPMVMEYVNNGQVRFIYRDWPFLGAESYQAAEAARCAGDQGKFWDYHDYLYAHQNGENKGAFSDINLKSFAKILGLDTAEFDECLDSNKYEASVKEEKSGGDKSGVKGTPKGFILKKNKVIYEIDGAEPADSVKTQIEAALK